MPLLRSSAGTLVRVPAILWAITESTHNTLEDNPILVTTEPTFTVDMKELNHVVSCSVPGERNCAVDLWDWNDVSPAFDIHIK